MCQICRQVEPAKLPKNPGCRHQRAPDPAGHRREASLKAFLATAAWKAVVSYLQHNVQRVITFLPVLITLQFVSEEGEHAQPERFACYRSRSKGHEVPAAPEQRPARHIRAPSR